MLQITSISSNNNDIDQLKPILRIIIESLVYVFMVNGFLMMALSLYKGGEMVYHLTKIPDLHSFDTSPRLACRLLAGASLLIGLINLSGLILFNRSQMAALFDQFLGKVSEDEVVISKRKKVQMWLTIISHLFNYVIQSLMPILFIYTMVMFQKVIRKLLDSFSKGKQLLSFEILNLLFLA